MTSRSRDEAVEMLAESIFKAKYPDFHERILRGDLVETDQSHVRAAEKVVDDLQLYVATETVIRGGQFVTQRALRSPWAAVGEPKTAQTMRFRAVIAPDGAPEQGQETT